MDPGLLTTGIPDTSYSLYSRFMLQSFLPITKKFKYLKKARFCVLGKRNFKNGDVKIRGKTVELNLQ